MAFQFIDEYPVHVKRNGCINCGAPCRPEERLIMFDQVVDEIMDLDGQTWSALSIVICEQCVIELAAMVDCLIPDHANRLRDQITTLKQQLTEAEEALGTKKDLQDTLMRLTDLAGDLTQEDVDA